MTAPLGIASTKAAPRLISAIWPTVRIGRTGLPTGMNFGRQPSSRTAGRLITTVFGVCLSWARTMVASMNSSSRSASPCSASATRCQTPYPSQHARRTYTEYQLPSSFGKSRHGDPVRARNRTASKNCRLSAAQPPLSVGLPGSKSAIRSYCSSLNIRRAMGNIQIPGCKHRSATVNKPQPPEKLTMSLTDLSCALIRCSFP